MSFRFKNYALINYVISMIRQGLQRVGRRENLYTLYERLRFLLSANQRIVRNDKLVRWL